MKLRSREPRTRSGIPRLVRGSNFLGKPREVNEKRKVPKNLEIKVRVEVTSFDNQRGCSTNSTNLQPYRLESNTDDSGRETDRVVSC